MRRVLYKYRKFLERKAAGLADQGVSKSGLIPMDDPALADDSPEEQANERDSDGLVSQSGPMIKLGRD
jgi:hypothetical protein